MNSRTKSFSWFWIAFLTLNLVPTARGQVPTPSPILLLESVRNAGLLGTAPADVTLEGILTDAKGPKPFRVLIKDRDKIRYEIDEGTNLIVTIYNAGRGWTIQGQRVQELQEHSSVRRPTLIPIFDLISEVNNPLLQAVDQGFKVRGPQTARHVSLALPDPEQRRHLGRKLDETLEVFIDPATSMVMRTERFRRTQENMDLQIPTALDFSDYRLVGGMLYVPFRIVSSSGNSIVGTHQSTFVVQRASVNTGISDSLFTPAGGGQ